MIMPRSYADVCIVVSVLGGGGGGVKSVVGDKICRQLCINMIVPVCESPEP